jgi:2OG-Fe(II) oxygenase superfamily
MRLENWIDQRHLEPALQAAYAREFASVPHSSVVIDNFLRSEKLAALQRVFSIEGMFEERHYLWGWVNKRAKGYDEAVSAEIWRAAPDEHRASIEYQFSGPQPAYLLGPGIVAQIKFKEMVGSQNFMGFLESISGIRPATLSGFNPRIIVGGQYIRPHNDFNPNRELCSVFYLSTEWDPSFGGRFRHRGPGPNIVPIEPRPNRLLVFQPRKDCAHDVEPISEAGERWQRWAYTLWFGTPPTGS